MPATEQTLHAKQQELANLKTEEAQAMQELNQQRSVLDEKRHSLSVSVSRNRVLDFLMKMKEKGEIPGIFGRLVCFVNSLLFHNDLLQICNNLLVILQGDLGGIDAKYDCAVSTACGPLDYIVVDSSITAKKCVTALKQHDVGKGTFIALDKQTKFIRNCQRSFKGYVSIVEYACF